MKDQFNMIQSIGHMSYDAFQAQYTKHYTGGLSVVTAFTWSKNINVGCASYWEGCNIQNPYDMRSNRSVDDVDVPLVFTLSGVYELPFGKDKPFVNSGIGSKVVGGWQVNGIVAARSGQPFTPHINFDNANANGGSQRPNVVGKISGPKTLNEYFNTSAYAVPAPYTYGNAGRNSLRGPGYTDVDSLSSEISNSSNATTRNSGPSRSIYSITRRVPGRMKTLSASTGHKPSNWAVSSVAF